MKTNEDPAIRVLSLFQVCRPCSSNSCRLMPPSTELQKLGKLRVRALPGQQLFRGEGSELFTTTRHKALAPLTTSDRKGCGKVSQHIQVEIQNLDGTFSS